MVITYTVLEEVKLRYPTSLGNGENLLYGVSEEVKLTHPAGLDLFGIGIKFS